MKDTIESQVVSGPEFFKRAQKEVVFNDRNVEVFAEGLKKLSSNKPICFTATQFKNTFGQSPKVKFMKAFRTKMYKAGLKPSILNEGNKLFIYKGKSSQN